MNEKNLLPVDFDGVFRFTNWTDRDFTGKWGGIAYTFPAMKTTPMIIRGESPEGTQHVRKKFAKELAEREFFNSAKLKDMEAKNPIGSATSIHAGLTYNPNDLQAFIQKCLEPLPVGQVKAEMVPNDAQTKTFSTDESGSPVSQVIGQNEKKSLVGQGQVIG